MALILVASIVVIPLLLLVSDLVLNVRRRDDRHVPFMEKAGTA